jgi:hypothetical protein
MDRSLIVEYLYHDGDIVEVNVSVWNGRFGGQTALYLEHGQLRSIVETLMGFPNNFSDIRQFSLGAFGKEFAGGAAALTFSCKDMAGHTQIVVHLEADQWKEAALEEVRLYFEFEPAALDRFVAELASIDSDLCGRATLEL